MRISDWSSDVCSSDLLYVAGLSNGSVIGYLYACTDPNVRAVLAVASDADTKSFTDACTTSHPLGSVIVHGTGDLTTPYNGFPLGLSLPIPAIHQTFNTLDGCNGDRKSTRLNSSH